MIQIDVNIDDIISALDKYDRRELMEGLQHDGYIPKECLIESDGSVELPSLMRKKIDCVTNNDFNRALQKLYNNGWKLTSEEEQYVINLSERFV